MGSDARGPRVLLVDDDAAVAKALAAMLSRGGFAVTTSANAREAEALLEERFDLLVLDLRMPGMRGDAFYYLARARQPWLETATLFISGDITLTAESLVRSTGCELLQKPFKGEDLIYALCRLLPSSVPAEVPRAG